MNGKYTAFIKRHLAIFIISFFIGFLMIAPAMYWKYIDSQSTGKLAFFKNDAEFHYIGRIQEVYDGHYRLSNPFLKDLKDSPYLSPPLPENIVAFFGKVFFLDALEAGQAFKFLAGVLLGILIYFFVLAVSKRRLAALVAACFVLLANNLVNPKYVFELFGLIPFSQSGQFLTFSRSIEPQVISLFFFGYLLSFWYFLNAKKLWSSLGFLSAVLLGLSFYVMPFIWSFIYALNGILFLIYIFRRDWFLAKKIVFVSAAALIFGIPYFINLHKAMNHPWYAESFGRFGFIKSRSFILSRLVIATFVLFLLFFKKIDRRSRLFIAALLLTALAVVNEQVLTGVFFSNNRYHWYYNTPIAIIVLTVIFFSLLNYLKLNKKAVQLFAAALILFFFFSGFLTQKFSYAVQKPIALKEQRYFPVFEWLNANTKKDDAVFAPTFLSGLIPAFTRNNVYYSGTAAYDLVPNERLFHIYYIYSFLNGVTEAAAKDYFYGRREDISYFVFSDYYRFSSCVACIPDSIIDKAINDYKEFLKQNFIQALKKYPVDYVVWDKKNDLVWQFDRFGLKKEAEFGDFAIYGF